MDHYSILDPGFSQTRSGMPNPAQIGLTSDIPQELPTIDALQLRPEVQVREEPASARMRVPREESASSIADIALRDLDAILQLLAERAEYITHATGAAIALWEGEEMVCRASAGASAPALGARLQVDAGLSGESVRTLQMLRCDDAETDTRVNRESCRALGIASVVVLPLVREQKVKGLFELFSDRGYAFAARDLEALERLGEMVDTALQHADAARAKPGVLDAIPIAEPNSAQSTHSSAPAIGAEKGDVPQQLGRPPVHGVVSGMPQSPVSRVGAGPALTVQGDTSSKPSSRDLSAQKVPTPTVAQSETVAVVQSRPTQPPQFANICKCETCGFPVSEGRKLCLDCEARAQQTEPLRRTNNASRNSEMSLGRQVNARKQLWIVENKYMVSAVVLFVMVLIAMLLSHSS